MTPEPTTLDLFGTDQPAPARRTLQAGLLSAVLEAGNLREIRYSGFEVLRGIRDLKEEPAQFQVRNADFLSGKVK